MAKKKVAAKENNNNENSKKNSSLAKRLQALDSLCEALSEQSGIVAGRPTKVKAVMERMTFRYIPTAVPALNEALGGGLPYGHIVLIAGKSDSGKTAACLETIAVNMKVNPDFIALWVESEDSVDVQAVKKLFPDIDLGRFYCISTTDPKTKKQIFGAEAIGNAIVKVIQDVDIDMCVINSLKMLVPMVETKKQMEEDVMATQAKFNSRFMKKMVPLCAQRGTNLTIVQHYTTNMAAGMYGNPDQIAGGKAIRYNNMVTLEFSKLKVDDGDPVTSDEGMKIKVRVTKNHCVIDRNPRVDVIYFIEYGKGVEKYITTLNQLINKGIVDKRGAWLYVYDSEGEKDPNMSWNGKTAFKQDMIDNPTKFDTLCAMLDGCTGDVIPLTAEENEAIDEAEEALDEEMQDLGISKVEEQAEKKES